MRTTIFFDQRDFRAIVKLAFHALSIRKQDRVEARGIDEPTALAIAYLINGLARYRPDDTRFMLAWVEPDNMAFTVIIKHCTDPKLVAALGDYYALRFKAADSDVGRFFIYRF